MNSVYHGMQALDNPEIESFLRCIGPLVSDYNGIDARIIAYQLNDRWVNVASRFVFSAGTRTKNVSKFDTLGILGLEVIQQYFPIGEVDKILNLFREGEIRVMNTDVTYRNWQNNAWTGTYPPQFRRLSRDESLEHTGTDSFCFSLRGSGNTWQASGGYQELAALQAKLSSLRTPYESLTDLVTELLGPLWFEQLEYSAPAEILAPVNVIFQRTGCGFGEGKIDYQFSVQGGHKPPDALVGFASYQASTPSSRGTAEGKGVTQKLGEEKYVTTGSIDVERSSNRTTLFLSYRGEEVDRLVLHSMSPGRNPRIAAHQILDPGLNQFRQELAGGKKFEKAVLTMFHFLGFSTFHTGLSSDAVDSICFTDDPSELWVVESTIDAPDLHNKLGKFSSRRRQYVSAMPGTKVMAILSTSLSREEISQLDLQRAREEKILLLAANEIMELNEMATEGSSRRNVIRYLLDKSREQFQSLP